MILHSGFLQQPVWRVRGGPIESRIGTAVRFEGQQYSARPTPCGAGSHQRNAVSKTQAAFCLRFSTEYKERAKMPRASKEAYQRYGDSNNGICPQKSASK